MTEKVNAGIITFWMDNINPKTVALQRQVVEKYNKSKHQHYSIRTIYNHGWSMDLAWAINGQRRPQFRDVQLPMKIDHDVLLFLDVDALPCNEDAIDLYIQEAADGKIVGNAQRSNHIVNDQHLFAAPSAFAASVDVMLTLGVPSAVPNHRGDVNEEITFKAEEKGIPVHLYLPLKFEEAPAECPFWALKDGMPVYGRGTTFGSETGVETFWHQFQSFHPGQQEKFWSKCEGILNG